MKIAMIGLGKMGANMTLRLLQGGHHVVVYDLNPEAVEESVRMGATGAQSLEHAVEQLDPVRVVWVMVPSVVGVQVGLAQLASFRSSAGVQLYTYGGVPPVAEPSSDMESPKVMVLFSPAFAESSVSVS